MQETQRVRKISWRREWQPTPLFLPEKPMDRGVWWATIHGVAESDMTDHARTIRNKEVNAKPAF